MTPLLDTRVSHIKNNNPRDRRISCRDLSTAASLRLSDFSTRRGNQVTPSLAFGGCAIFLAWIISTGKSVPFICKMTDFCRRAMLSKRGLCHHAVSVRLSITFVHYVKTNKHNLFFLPSGNHAILVFPYQTSWHYSDRNPPNGGVECRCGRQKSRFWANIWLHRVLSTLRTSNAIHLAATDHGELMTLVAGSKRRSLLMAGDDDEAFNVTPKTTEHNLIVRSGKSEAWVTIIEDFAAGITLLKLTTDKHKASRGLSATAGLLVSKY